MKGTIKCIYLPLVCNRSNGILATLENLMKLLQQNLTMVLWDFLHSECKIVISLTLCYQSLFCQGDSYQFLLNGESMH